MFGSLQRRRGGLRVPVVVAAAAALLACLFAVSAGARDTRVKTARTGGSAITWAVSADVTGLDPLTNGQVVSSNVLFRAYQSLIGINADGSTLSPLLATSWKKTSPTRYVFAIRHGVRFSNGRLMTSADVAGSIELALKPGSAGGDNISMIASAKATGPYTVVINLKHPSGFFLLGIASQYASILPIKELKAKTFDPNKRVLGTGPYMVVSHRADESWTLKANPYYWQAGLPKVKKLVIDIIPDPAAMLAALRSGRVDAAEFQDPNTIKLLERTAHVKVVRQQTTNFNILELNAVNPSSKVLNQQVRQALALAIDRKQLVTLAEAGAGVPMVAPGATPGQPGACSPSSVPHDDMAKAKALLHAAGADGLSFPISYDTGDPVNTSIALVLQSQWQAIGLKPVLDGSANAAWGAQVYTNGAFSADLSWYGAPTPWQNHAYWSPTQKTWTAKFSAADPKIDSLLADAAPLSSGPAQSSIFNQLCQQEATDANLVPLTTRGLAMAYRTDLINPKIQTFELEQNTVKFIAGWTLR